MEIGGNIVKFEPNTFHGMLMSRELHFHYTRYIALSLIQMDKIDKCREVDLYLKSSLDELLVLSLNN